MFAALFAGPSALVLYFLGFKNAAALLMIVIPVGAIVGMIVTRSLKW